MEFPQAIKKRARRASAFKCSYCHEKPCDDIHHIDPLKGDVFENAAPLCAQCHGMYGNNPNKREQIRQSRDWWFKHVKNTYNVRDKAIEELEILDKQKNVQFDESFKPLIADIKTNVDLLYASFQKGNVDEVRKTANGLLLSTATMTSGIALVKKNCPYCGREVPHWYFGECPDCGNTI